MQSKKRQAFGAAILAGVAALVVGCSEPTADNAGGGSASGSGDKVTLNVYTSEPEEKVDEINQAFMEANPDIEVQVYRAGTGDLNARIATEKESGSIEADVLWAADAPTFEKYQEDGDLAPLDGVDTSAVIEDVVDPDNYYVGTRLMPTVIAYNTNVISEDDVPTSWQDLTDPKYKDKIVLPNPAVSGAAAFNASVWKNEPSLGTAWFDELAKNAPMVAESNGPTSQAVADGSRPVGIVVDYLVRELEAKGSPVKTVYASEGSPYITEPAAIFEASEEKDAAKKYIEFLISEEGQKLAVEQSYLPVREDVGTPEGAPALEEIALFTPDLALVTKDKDAAVEAFQKAIG